MKVQIEDKSFQDKVFEDVKRLEVWVTEDKKFSLYFNKFGELEINKQTFDSESSTIIIKPSVSNHINLI
jgi:hypothetical protein